MNKSTPGPWEVKDIPSMGLQIQAKVDIGKDDMSGGVLQPLYGVSLTPSLTVNKDGTVFMMIAHESCRQFPSTNFQEMQQANAKLIAKAPEQQAVIDELVDALQHIANGTLPNYFEARGPVREAIRKFAQQAIDKATTTD